MKTLILLMTLLLSACATDPATTQAYLDAQEARAAQPTLSLVCPGGGCALSYTDPRDRQGLRMPTNGWDALTSIGNNVTSLVPIIVTGRIATAGFDALRNSGGTQTSHTTGPVSTSTTGAVSTVGATTHTTTSANPSTTTTLSGTGVLGNGTYSTQANPVTSTVTTTNPVPVAVP